LEAQFRAIVDEEIRKQPQIARLGSQYKNDAKVSGYVNTLISAMGVRLSWDSDIYIAPS